MFITEPGGLNALRALTTAIGRTDSADAVFQAALDALEAALGVRRASILLFDADGVMRFKRWRGLSDAYRTAVEGHTPWTPDTSDAEIIVVEDVSADASLTPFLPTIHAEGIAAMAFVPLTTEAGVIGKLMLYFDQTRTLGDSEQALAGVIAAQVAFAVQRMRAEQAARDRDRELRLVADVAPVYIVHCDRDRRYKFVNRPFAARFGLRPSQVVGRTIEDVLGDEVYASLRERIDTVLSGTPVEFEHEVRYPVIGQRIWHVKYSPELDASGGVCGFVGAIADVTDLRQALGASEALFRQLADALPQFIWMAGSDGRIDYYNERWLELVGPTPGSAPADAWFRVMHGDDVQATADAWMQSVRTGDPFERQYRLFDRATGTYRWHLGRALPVRDDDGQVVRWFGSGTDIDDQKRTEQASRFLAEAGRTLSGLVDYPSALEAIADLAVPDFADWCAVDIVGLDGSLGRLALSHWDRTKIDFAREFQQRFPQREGDEYGPHRVVRTGVATLIPKVTEEMLRAIAHNEEHFRLLRRAGIRSCILVPLRAGHEVIGAITFLTSDSGRQYGAADLATAEEVAYRASIAIENARLYSDVQRADRQKDEFLAVLAHELRNPLAPIRTALQLVRLSPNDRTMRDRAWDVMDRQVQQMIRLVDDLLDVSRITRGKVELQKQRMELASVVSQAVETSRPIIEAAGHELTVTVPAEPIELEADPTRIAQVFSNLLNNAAKYTPRGGHISITAERQNGEATIRVRDSGVGIPDDMLTGIFDMFTQVDRSLEKTQGGLGIGLTLVKRLVELHGGTVEAHSDGPGTGSEFVVSLPAREIALVRPVLQPHRHETLSPSRRLRVLVADDNRDAADCLAEMLRLSGHDVRTAHDGLAALEAADTFTPEVALLDLGMPRLNGYEAAEQLRDRFSEEIVLIAITGWGQDDDRRRSAEAGFDRHLVKPVDPEMLTALLADLTDPGRADTSVWSAVDEPPRRRYGSTMRFVASDASTKRSRSS